MQKLKRLIINTTMLSLVLVFGASIPAYAIGDAGAVNPPEVQTSTETEHHTTTPTPTPESPKPHTETAEAQHQAELHKQAEADLAAMREKHQETKTTNTAERQKKCEDHKHGLNTKFSRISTNSQKIQDHIDSVFAKAQAYQQAKNLQPENYDALVAAATSAQTASAASIATLKTLTPTIDCTGTNTASDVAAFKAAAADTRAKLKAYRSAVKDVLKALEIAKPKTEGSNQ